MLNKASEYSNFISRDLDDLQASMTEEATEKARKEAAKAEKKKRKSEAKGAGSKKLKTSSEGAKKLETVQAEDAVARQRDKPIFVQPPNLAKDCFLKDYQLEGVRWLASLYENGVSGVLADEYVFLRSSPLDFFPLLVRTVFVIRFNTHIVVFVCFL